MGSANNIQTLLRHMTAGVQSGFLSFVGSTDHHLLLRPVNPWNWRVDQTAIG
jgi:hypothetical protein